MTHWSPFATYAAALLDIELSDEQLLQFERLTQLLLTWNERMNLTAITDPAEIAIKHYLDAMTLKQVLPQVDGLHLIDVGAGAGFPGLPLAIAFPKLQTMLMDSTAKKLRFIDHAAESLGLENVRTMHARAEDAGRDQLHRQAYDVVVARAVARLPILLEYSLPLCKLGGQVIAMKGASAFDETNAAAKAIDALGGELFAIEEITLPTLDHPRYLVVIDKVAATPKRYPRKAGTPSRQPIL
ncbi:MAG: 16S rRNA (guanine(527)-N(7))-methyltransferase RsmG [Chloroflexi bacterium]|nr:16S rRNA (guanine(527)-N(7))-methyltransferase RsmG [Chloroflexota bacterium]